MLRFGPLLRLFSSPTTILFKPKKRVCPLEPIAERPRFRLTNQRRVHVQFVAESKYREGRLRAHIETTERHRQGLAMMGNEHLLLNAEERAKLLQEEGLLNLDPGPLKIDIYVTVGRYDKSFCWKGPLLLGSAHVWVQGSRGAKTLNDRRTFRAQHLVRWHGAPTTDDYEEDNECYSKKHGKEAHERHREEDALFEARRDEEDRKLRKLLDAMGREPSTPTPLKCSCTAPTAPLPDSVFYPPDK